jgi:hypothetical protein
MLLRDKLLASVSKLLFIPLNRFQKALQCPRSGVESQGDGFRRLAVQVGELPFDINQQQYPRVASAETIGEQRKKRNQFPSQAFDLF